MAEAGGPRCRSTSREITKPSPDDSQRTPEVAKQHGQVFVRRHVLVPVIVGDRQISPLKKRLRVRRQY